MNILVMDTSGGYLTVAAYKNGEWFSTYIADCAMRQSVLLMDAVDETLKKADMRLFECDCFGAVVGAGSFTGIRIGISVAKGFALAYNKPLLPITSFEILAYNGIGGKTTCLVDALHDSYYACAYDGLQIQGEPEFLSEAEVLDRAKREGRTLLSLTELPLQEKMPITLCDAVVGLQNVAYKKAQAQAFGELNALYVRKSSAEEQLKK